MHLAFLTTEYPHPQIEHAAGIGTSIKNLALALTQKGIRVTVIVYGQDSDTRFKDGGIAIIKLKNIKLTGLSWLLTRKKIQRKINDLVLNEKLSAVEAPDWTGITSFINIKCPLIIRIHGSDTYFCSIEGRNVKFWNKFHEKRALQKADGILSVSKYAADKTRELFDLKKEIKVIHNGINTQYFESSKEEMTTKEVKTILYFGTLIRKKGVLDIPFIFNKVRNNFDENIELILIGGDSGDVKTNSNSTWVLMKTMFSEESKENVNYLGKIEYSEIKRWIENSTVCVFPSYAEALPVSWLEAMAMQKAIVASDIGWAKEMIKDNESGFLVNPKNHELFAQRIITLLNDNEKSIKMGNAARKAVFDKFDITNIADQNIEYYISKIKK